MKRTTLLLFNSVILCVAMVGASCDVTTAGNTTPTRLTAQYPNWTAVATGVDFKQVQITDTKFGSELFDIVRIDPQQQIITPVFNSNNPATVADWQQTLAASVVINGTYFNERNQPTTLLVLNNQSFGHFLTGPTGVFTSADQRRWQIAATESRPTAAWVMQSYPVLFSSEHPLLQSSSTDQARRTIVAIDVDGLVYWLVTEYGNLTLAQLADVVHNQLGLNLTEALNLDGGSSTGLVIQSPHLHYQTNSLAVPGVLYLPKD